MVGYASILCPSGAQARIRDIAHRDGAWRARSSHVDIAGTCMPLPQAWKGKQHSGHARSTTDSDDDFTIELFEAKRGVPRGR